MALPSYFSGDLASLTSGEIADNAQQSDAESAYRSYLLGLANQRNSRYLGEGNLSNDRSRIAATLDIARGNQAVDRDRNDVMRQLGLGQIDNTRYRDTGDLAYKNADIGLKYNQLLEEGRRYTEGLKSRLDELEKQAAIARTLGAAGAFTPPQVAAENARNQNNLLLMQKEADSAAETANMMLPSAIQKHGPWYRSDAYAASDFANEAADPSKRTGGFGHVDFDKVYSDVIRGLGQNASLVSFDPATGSFKARQFFGNTANPVDSTTDGSDQADQVNALRQLKSMGIDPTNIRNFLKNRK